MVSQLLEEVELEGMSNDARFLQDFLPLRRKTSQTLMDNGTDVFRNHDFDRSTAPPAVGITIDVSGLDQSAQYLLDKERIPIGMRVNDFHQLLRRMLRTEHDCNEVGRSRPIQAPELQARQKAVAMKVEQRSIQRMVLVDLHVSVRAEQENAIGPAMSR